MNDTRDTPDETSTVPVGPEFDPQTLDTYYHVLADERRRIVIRLLEHESTVHFDDLARKVYQRESLTDSPEKVRISLIHQHVPLLADVGVLEYDREDEVVVGKEPAIEYLSALLECTPT